MESKTVRLSESIKLGSEIIASLEFRKPRAKDFRTFPQNPNTGDLLNLAGRLCGQPPSVMDELCVEDMVEVLHVVENFIEGGQKTGGKS